MSCFGTFDTWVQLNPFITNQMQIPLFLSGHWNEYPSQKYAVIALFAMTTLTIARGVYKMATSTLSSDGRSLSTLNPDVKYGDAEVWRRTQFNPFLVLFWQLLVQVIYLTFIFAGLSSASIEPILLHGWAEFLLFLQLYYANSSDLPFNKSWQSIFTLLLGVVIGYLINQFIFGMTGNPFIQGILSAIAVIGDFGHPITATIYAMSGYTNLGQEGTTIKHYEKIVAWLHAALAWIHLVLFYIPALTCANMGLSATLIVLFDAISLAVLIPYVLHIQNYFDAYSTDPIPLLI